MELDPSGRYRFAFTIGGLGPGRCDADSFCPNNLVRLDKLYYQRSLGPNGQITAGSRVNQKDMIGLWPSLFDDNELTLSVFGKAGAPGAYSDLKGAGVGLVWRWPMAPDDARPPPPCRPAGSGRAGWWPPPTPATRPAPSIPAA